MKARHHTAQTKLDVQHDELRHQAKRRRRRVNPDLIRTAPTVIPTDDELLAAWKASRSNAG